MEAVKGQSGYYHATNGDWVNHHQLRTYCGRGISPIHRRLSRPKRAITCLKCLEIIAIREDKDAKSRKVR